jgi:circadian clock protein KaiC
MSADGIELREAYIGRAGVLTGSARLAQEAEDNAAALIREREIQRRSRDLERKRREISAQIEVLQTQLASEVGEDSSSPGVRETCTTADIGCLELPLTEAL